MVGNLTGVGVPPQAPRIEYDLAYGAFAFSGLATLSVSVLGALDLSTGMAGGIGILIALPMFVSGLLATMLGIGLAAKLRTDLMLLAMSVPAAWFLVDFFLEATPPHLRRILGIGYGVVTIGVGAHWWIAKRSRSPS